MILYSEKELFFRTKILHQRILNREELIRLKIKIREYRESDWEKVLKIFEQGKQDELKESVRAEEIIPLNEDDRLLKSFFESVIIVAVNENDVLGFAGYNKELITFLFIDKKHYRRKVASTLLENLLYKLGENAWLYVAKLNTSAQKLYIKYNFQIVEEFIGNYKGNKVEVYKMAINPKLKYWENSEI